MRYVIASLLVVGLLSAASVMKVEAPTVTKATITDRPQLHSTILTDQPDTIAYDDWSPAWGYSPCAGCLGAVRFTACGNFDLRVVVFDIYNIGGATDSFFITVYDTLDGTILGGPYGLVIDAGFWTYQVDLPDTISITSGDDFYIVIGPQVGWTFNTLVFDNGTTVFRSYVNFTGTDWVNEDGGDLCLRALGERTTPCIDPADICTWNDIQKFFFLDNEAITLLSDIKNLGTDSLTDYTVYFFVRDTFGAQYFSEAVPGTQMILPGQTVTVSATQTFTAPTPGYYIAIDSVVAPGDMDLSNNVTVMELRPYDASVGNWFWYTDMTAEACFSWVEGNTWATGFKLNCYPVTLDSIAIAFGVSPDTIATDVPFEVWWGMDMPETVVIAGTIDSVFDGYIHLISFDPPITVDSGMIFVAYPYYIDPDGDGACLFQDQTAPVAGMNWCVDVTTFQRYGDPPTWYDDNSGDWFMWAFFSECVTHPYDCGDVNGNGVVGYDDLTYLAAYLFAGGPPPLDMWTADVNCNGVVGYDDLTYLAAYLFAGGPPPDCCP